MMVWLILVLIGVMARPCLHRALCTQYRMRDLIILIKMAKPPSHMDCMV